MANNRRSNTVEIDSILAETRGRKGGKAPARSAAQTKAAPAAKKRSLNDDFVFIDDNGKRVSAPQKTGRKAPAKQPVAKPKKKKRTGLIVAICIISLLVIAAAGGLTWYLTSGSGTGPDSKFSDNVYVSGKSLKDLTMDDARTLMKSVEDEMAGGIRFDVKAGDKTYTFTKDDVDYSFDTEAVLAQAKAYSEERGLKTEDQNYEIKMTVTDSTCADLVKKVADDVKKDPKDAQVTGFDPFADPMFTFSSESEGVVLDEKACLEAFSGLINGGSISGTIEATLNEIDPKVTASALESSIIKLSSFSTYSSNNENGNENMRISLAACNGSVIEPGATWSFNDCTGNSNLESNGYLPAGVIVQGRSETGVGGGICQSSTTIYNAAILCGMQVVERSCHYYKSVYADAGRDATIDYGNIDLRLKNPFSYQLFMKCWMDGTELNCEIYGMDNPDFDDIEIYTSDPTYFDKGYTVYTTRSYLKDGQVVKTDDLPSSTYYTVAPSSGRSDDDDDDDDDGNSSSSGSSSDDPDDSSSSGGGEEGDENADSASDDGEDGSPDDGDDASDDGGDEYTGDGDGEALYDSGDEYADNGSDE